MSLVQHALVQIMTTTCGGSGAVEDRLAFQPHRNLSSAAFPSSPAHREEQRSGVLVDLEQPGNIRGCQIRSVWA